MIHVDLVNDNCVFVVLAAILSSSDEELSVIQGTGYRLSPLSKLIELDELPLASSTSDVKTLDRIKHLINAVACNGVDFAIHGQAAVIITCLLKAGRYFKFTGRKIEAED